VAFLLSAAAGSATATTTRRGFLRSVRNLIYNDCNDGDADCNDDNELGYVNNNNINNDYEFEANNNNINDDYDFEAAEDHDYYFSGNNRFDDFLDEILDEYEEREEETEARAYSNVAEKMKKKHNNLMASERAFSQVAEKMKAKHANNDEYEAQSRAFSNVGEKMKKKHNMEAKARNKHHNHEVDNSMEEVNERAFSNVAGLRGHNSGATAVNSKMEAVASRSLP